MSKLDSLKSELAEVQREMMNHGFSKLKDSDRQAWEHEHKELIHKQNELKSQIAKLESRK